MESIQLGLLINEILKSDIQILKLIKNKVFPHVAELETNYPFITYDVISIIPSYTKWGKADDDITFRISVISDKYKDCVNILQLIRNAFELKEIDNKEIKIEEISQSYNSDAYIQSITFKIKN